MSHAPERKDKNCLNCGTIVVGRYCHVCGQENLEPKESVWQLVTHFFNDITHFDGKFFQTLKVLLLRPGFLSREYMNGRRASYLNPVRMYVFTSAIFFLLFFTFFQTGDVVKATFNGKTIAQINNMDSASFAKFTSSLNDSAKPMTRKQFQAFYDTNFPSGLHFGGQTYRSNEEYDSLLAAGKRKDSWLERQFIYKQIAINQKYNNNSQQIISAFTHGIIHSLPQMLFVSLPLLALILKLLYVRRKQFYYVSHGIFAIHLYIFIFISQLVLFSLSKLNDAVHWKPLSSVVGIFIIGLFVYEYLSMKNFYKQGWIKTFFKFLLLNFLFLIILVVVFVIFTFFSFFNI